MQIVYSALYTTGKRPDNNPASARYRGYLAACEKHRETIAAIQQYLPDWQPEFRIAQSKPLSLRSVSRRRVIA